MTTSQNSRAITFEEINHVILRPVTVPPPGPGEVRIATAFTAISPGTERRCLAGKQAGAPAFPFIPGYALTGTVCEVGEGVALALGAPVYCAGTRRVEGANRLWGGHISHAVRPASEVFPLPATLSLADAALARLAAIAYHGLRLARPQPHESVAVVGLGVIGALAARLYRAAGCNVIGIDPLASRRSQPWCVASISEAQTLLPEGADIVVDATGVPAVLEEVLTLARPLPYDDSLERGARLVIQGSYPGSFPLSYDALFQKELSVLVPRDCQPRDIQAVLQLLHRGTLSVRDLYACIAVTKAPEYYAQLGSPDLAPTLVFDWSSLVS